MRLTILKVMKNLILNKIENLFEPEMILENFSFLTEKNSFNVEDNYKLIENLGYFQNAEPNWSVYFSHLTPFFELGLFFQSDATQAHQLQTVFYGGQIHDCSEAKMKVKLPPTPLFDIYKTSANGFLKKIKISSLVDSSKMECHLVRVQNDIAFVVFSKKGDLWNKLLMESFQKSLINYSL